jgi:hypothetical protein
MREPRRVTPATASPWTVSPISLAGPAPCRRLDHAIVEALPFGVGDGPCEGAKAQANLDEGVVRSCPAHQRLDRPVPERIEFKNPRPGLCSPRLHSGR